MALHESLLAELDQELPGTRRTLERLPEERLGWRPHDKSMTLAALGGHLANLPSWGADTLQNDSFDVAPGGERLVLEEPTSRAEIVALFDRGATALREALAATSDEAFQQPWTLQANGEEIFTLPRIAVIRGMIINHMIHHRAQLTVYLRLNDVPVPALYGPSADEE